MTTMTAHKAARYVTVRCVECGDTEQINDRSRRRKLAEGKPHVCRLCRQIRNIKITESDRNYWRKRFTQEEIEAMAHAIWG